MHRINQWVPDKQPSLCTRLYCKCSCNHKPTNHELHNHYSSYEEFKQSRKCSCHCCHLADSYYRFSYLPGPRNPSWNDDDMSEYKSNFYEIKETITNPTNLSNQYYMNPNYPESGIFSSNSSSDLHSMASSSNLLAEPDHDYMDFKEPQLIKTCFPQKVEPCHVIKDEKLFNKKQQLIKKQNPKPNLHANSSSNLLDNYIDFIEPQLIKTYFPKKFEPCNVTIDEKAFHKKPIRAPKAKHNLNGNYTKSKLFKDLNDFLMNNELNSPLVYRTITSVLNARNLENSWTIAQKVLYMGLKVAKLLLKEEIFGQLDDELESHIEDVESTISYLNQYLSYCSSKRTVKKEEAELVTRKISPTKISSPLNNQMLLLDRFLDPEDVVLEKIRKRTEFAKMISKHNKQKKTKPTKVSSTQPQVENHIKWIENAITEQQKTSLDQQKRLDYLEDCNRIQNSLRILKQMDDTNRGWRNKKNLLESSARSEEILTKMFIWHYNPSNLMVIPPSYVWKRNLCCLYNFQHNLNIDSGSKREISWNYFPEDPQKIIQIEGDGNCLFRALAYFITGTDNNQDHVKIRFEICEYLLANHYKPKIQAITRMDVMKYLQQNDYAIQQPATSVEQIERFGTDVEIQIFAEMTNCVVYVWNPKFYEEKDMKTRWKSFGSEGGDEKPTFFLEFKDGNHFNVVLI